MQPLYFRVRSLVVSDLRSESKGCRFELAMCREVSSDRKKKYATGQPFT